MSRREDARLGVCFVLTAIVCGGLAMAALLQALGHTAVSPSSGASSSWVRGLLPEGWKFFTRDPREEGLYLRVAAGGGWVDGRPGPGSSPRHLSGLRRTTRAVAAESGVFLAQISQESWTRCDTGADECLGRLQPVATLVNPSRHPTLCGDVGLVLRKPVPWAWERRFAAVTMPSRVARVRITCSR